ncbi:aromatic amino acid lyase, partial [Bacteroides fragilis]|nr:aromatic amino acid lyase [Bacteroides fragilis]
SGHMIAQYAQAGIVSEMKRLANPSSADSIPSSAMQEDHVSMGWSAARKLRKAVDGLQRVLAVESGHMIAQYAQAGIVSEMKRLANPSSADSIPSSA